MKPRLRDHSRQNMNIDEEIVTSDDKPVLFVPEDPGTGIVGARDLSSEAEAEFKKQQEETLEETLKALIQRCEPLSHPRSQMPDSDYMEALQESLDNILDRRLALVKLWISVNTDHLPPENPDLLELNRVFDLLKRDMMAAVRLCRSGCASCGLQCIRAYSHSGEHDCSTDHKCKSHCEVLDDHSDLPSCGQKAGHTGRHMCDVNNHSCGSACNLSGWAGCTQICTKPLDHKDEHLCSAPSHHCGKPCDLRNVPGGPISSKFDCPGICQKPCVKNPPDCCSTDHFHGLNLDATHICRADHACSENCEADGICHIDFTPSEKTFIGKHASYAYTRHEQVGKKLPCKVRIPQGEVSHLGPHNHDPEKNEHQCDAQCSGCKYYCTHPINHRQRLHATVHGSMIGTQWVIESEANEAYKLEEHRYASGDSGDIEWNQSPTEIKTGSHMLRTGSEQVLKFEFSDLIVILTMRDAQIRFEATLVVLTPRMEIHPSASYRYSMHQKVSILRRQADTFHKMAINSRVLILQTFVKLTM
ncbi:unnamed protein product [Rhizoctonia solani]|uniref:Uncharacterized protein n=1 Tax=Rhizoctonia solani TaxID=456999 RepID=A0A8H3B1H6_9AGAM|nr:unnamed protein product [Rhizoctonia solani]